MHRHASVNRIYRLVWSHACGSWVPAAETSRGRKKGSSKTLLATALSLAAGLTEAAPLGGQILGGTGHIGQSGPLTTITQSSPTLSLSWASFNIAPQETVDFVQPSASSIAVNRITGSNGTQILGHLEANGQVYLINPNGIVFGRGAQVDVGGLVASTLDVDTASLASAARTFSGMGSGSVINQGTIHAAGDGSGGGYVALLGTHVANQGTIVAQLGTVALGAGSAATLTFQGDSLVHLQVDRSVLNSVAANGGLIRADGGQVLMSAGAKDTLLASVVNNTGVIEARAVEDHAGTITLLGGMAAGTVNVAGTLDASAPQGSSGGVIETSAANVEVADSAKITTAAASGLTGSWLIDPHDFTVAASGGNITGATLSGQLATTNETLQSGAGTAGGSGNVNINDAVSWSANTTLTLTAANNVNVNASVTANGNLAGVVINPNTGNGSDAASGVGTLTFNHGAAINLSGTSATVSVAGVSYIIINSLGVAADATTAPLTPSLQGMAAAANAAKNYALGSNINAAATSAWNTGAGFTPIGNSSNAYLGNFTGLGHTISNLFIDLPSTINIGLFGYVGSFNTTSHVSAIQNVGLIGGSVTGSGSVGALVGQSSDNINNSFATGTVTGSANVGGLVGQSTGNQYSAATVSNSYATGNVSGSTNVGGLVGSQSYGSISNSYATGNVTAGSGSGNVGGLVGSQFDGGISSSHATGSVSAGSGSTDAGGLIGGSRGGGGYGGSSSITNSYASGNVTVASGGSNVGGLVGTNTGVYAVNGYGNPTPATIANSYATGTVNAGSLGSNVGGLVGNNSGNAPISTSYATGSVTGVSSTIGGLVGANSGGIISQSYWDTTTSGQATSAQTNNSQSNVGGLTTSQMRTAANFAGFGFSTVPGASGNSWVMVDADGTLNNAGSTLGATFPMLTSEYSTVIGNAHQLQLMAMALGASYKLAAIVDLSATGTAVGNGSGDVWSTTGGFVPVGRASAPFTGSLDGSGYAINNLNIYLYSSYNVGLFGVASSSSTIQNVGLIGGSVRGYRYLGDLAGQDAGSINNSYATGAVSTNYDTSSGTYPTGGLVGLSQGAISNSYATGPVFGCGDVGGLVGESDAPITNSYATGSVNGQIYANGVGGLVGVNRSTITKSYATGTVYGPKSAGGLVGSNYGSVSTSYATGDVTGVNNAGGLVGTNDSGGSIGNSYATGSVSGGGYSGASAGGLVGVNSGTIANSYATGSVFGGGYGGGTAGGLVGLNTGTISKSYSTGGASVANGGYGNGGTAGGLVGVNLGSVSNSFWDTTTSGLTYSAGGTGMATAQMQLPANFTSATAANGYVNPAWDFAATWVITGQSYPLFIGFNLTPLTITANNVNKTYNGSAFSGDSNGVTYSIPGAASDFFGTITYTGTSQGVIDVGGGTFSITPGGLQQTANLYSVTYVSGALTMSKLALSANIAVGNSVYGTALAPGAVTFTNAIGSGTVLPGTVSVNTTGLTSSGGKLVAGTHLGIETVGSTLTGVDAGDYTFAGAFGDYTVTPLALSGVIATGGSIYGSALTPGAVTLTNPIVGDVVTAGTVTVNTINHTSTSGHFTAGLHTGSESVGNTLSGADAADYTFAGTTGNYTVTPLALSGAIATGTSIYGATLAPGSVTLTTPVVGDVITAGTVTVSTVNHTSTSGHFTAGTHTGSESVGSILTGADAADYTFAGAFGDYTVTPLALSGIIGAGSSIYGATLAPGALTLATPLVGDVVSAGSVAVNTTNQTTTSGHLTAGTHIGSESVGGTLTGTDASDYTFAGAIGDYTVTPLALSVSATGVNKIYDGTTSAAPTLSSAAVILGDQVAFTDTAANFASKNAGSNQAVVVSGIAMGGADAADYALNSTSAQTIATISPASLTVSGVAVGNKTYDGNAAAILAGGSLAGVVAGDAGSVSLIDAGSFATKNVGTGISVAAAETLSGAGAGNYVLVQPTGLVASITPATLTYEATPASRTVGHLPTGLGGSLSGFVAGESQSNDTAGTLAWTTPANAGSGAGHYAIDGGGLTATNYVFVEAPGNAAALTLAPAAVPPPPVSAAPALPPGALSAIAALQAMVQVSGAGPPESFDEPPTLLAAEGADSLASTWHVDPLDDTSRRIGTTPGSIRIVNGGVRLPQ